ncbi:hypothetical protein HF324_25165 [Chitinophaga oryzae]|uniref:Outer membrane protein beta-barrel domain-containing protein n=1 Tax=Chitinophaga oryzae TaxID=2725414 RepID=A0ABX6LLD4_9BACT|nr:hypothetical protein [Chitinophaga oryzae]QJB40952.1 hypothetical protein HF324_25165 [Chitinophaga oryzae]
MSEDFENSIRNKLNEADHPFDPQAWEKMEALLDGDKGRKPVLIWWWAAAAILLLALGVWWFMPDTGSTKQQQQITGAQHFPGENLPEKNSGRLPEKKENQEKTPEKYQQLPVAVPAVTNQQPGTAGKEALVIPSYTIAANNDSGTLRLQGSETNPPALSQQRPVLPLSGETIVNNINDYTKIDSNNLNDYTKIDTPAVKEDYQTVSVALKDSTLTAVTRKTKKWYAGLVFGPDLTVAPSFKYGNIGFNAGVLVHYYFNRNLFVTTGAVYSKKIYGASPNDYRTGSTSTPYGTLEKVNADCDVLDVPINMNYTFLSVKKNKVSATLGFSNYFMLKEKYRYLYEYGPPKERTVTNENQHYLSIINAGILYQRPSGRGLLLGVQPYVKIPLNGVGYGQVKLYSAGMTVHLTFTGKKP